MCFGGGKSAEDYYNEIKVDPAPLPSLRKDANIGEMRKPKYGDYGVTTRSLLQPLGDPNAK